MNVAPDPYALALQYIADETRNATARHMGDNPAQLASARENCLAGMVELAQLLDLPQDFIDGLDAQRWALIRAARQV